MNKFLYYNDLFNFYKELLTTKEKEIFALYYEENYSMGEISENLNISRSAVGNTVKIVENKLSKYESILHIKEKNEKLMELSAQTGQFYRGTLKRGDTLESEASIVILGDVEFGAKVVAKGNIIILGTLYGSVHAGAAGDRNAFIIALSMQPQRLVIGDIEAKRQLIYQDSLSINGPQIAVVDGKRIYLDPLIE